MSVTAPETCTVKDSTTFPVRYARLAASGYSGSTLVTRTGAADGPGPAAGFSAAPALDDNIARTISRGLTRSVYAPVCALIGSRAAFRQQWEIVAA